MQKRFGRVLDGILVACAVASTIALVGPRIRSRTATAGDFRQFAGWREDLAFPRRIGLPDARYQLVIWTDYQCPACKRFEQEVDRLKAQLKDSLTVVYRYLPLDSHPLAIPAAIAAECAHGQGLFEAMHRSLFATRLAGDSLPIRSLASAVRGLDVAKFKACLNDSTAAAAVRADIVRAKALELRGTPSLQVGDRIGTGGRIAEELWPLLRTAVR